MDIFEDLGGCLVLAAVALIVLVLVVFVALLVLGVASTDLLG